MLASKFGAYEISASSKKQQSHDHIRLLIHVRAFNLNFYGHIKPLKSKQHLIFKRRCPQQSSRGLACEICFSPEAMACVKFKAQAWLNGAIINIYPSAFGRTRGWVTNEGRPFFPPSLSSRNGPRAQSSTSPRAARYQDWFHDPREMIQSREEIISLREGVFRLIGNSFASVSLGDSFAFCTATAFSFDT